MHTKWSLHFQWADANWPFSKILNACESRNLPKPLRSHKVQSKSVMVNHPYSTQYKYALQYNGCEPTKDGIPGAHTHHHFQMSLLNNFNHRIGCSIYFCTVNNKFIQHQKDEEEEKKIKNENEEKRNCRCLCLHLKP